MIVRRAFLLVTFCSALACCSEPTQDTSSPFDRFENGNTTAAENVGHDSQPIRFSGSSEMELSSSPTSTQFARCGKNRITCVVDGDTFWIDGVKVRIADIDTPEMSQPKCAYEKQQAELATDRLMQLLNAGPFELVSIGAKDEDQYGRKLRVVVRKGRSVGDQLTKEGLARTWTGKREPWC